MAIKKANSQSANENLDEDASHPKNSDRILRSHRNKQLLTDNKTVDDTRNRIYPEIPQELLDDDDDDNIKDNGFENVDNKSLKTNRRQIHYHPLPIRRVVGSNIDSSKRLSNSKLKENFSRTSTVYKVPYKQPKKKSSFWRNFILLLLLLSVILFLWFGLMSRFQDNSYKEIELQKLLTSKPFNHSLPSIGKKVITTAFRQALDTSFNLPVLLLLIGSSSQRELLHSFSEQLAKLAGHHKLIELTVSTTKEELEQYYLDTFNSNRSKVLILHDLHQLPSSEVMIFHQFVDEERSKVRSSFVIVTLQYTSPVTIEEPISFNEIEQLSSKLLDQLWGSTLDKDVSDSLINRFAERPVALISS